MLPPKKLFKICLWLGLASICGALCALSAVSLYLTPKLPDVESLRQVQLQTPLRIFSSDEQLIGEFGEKRRIPVSISDTPQEFIDAILAAEDDRFYSHNGVDLKGLMRAASQLLQSGHIQSGGSTITMQVARNFFLTRKQTFTRKFNEILLAIQIEQELSKAEILELYINKIYLGNRAYGAAAAAEVYYGKSLNELSLAQLAMIAGLPKAPSIYNPIVNPERALVRRNWILGRMQSLNYISEDDLSLATSEPVSAAYHGAKLGLSAPYVAEMARSQALEILGKKAYTDGYRVHTTVSTRLQQAAQQAVIDGLTNYDQRHGYRGPEAHLALSPQKEPKGPLQIPEGPAPEALSPEQLSEWQDQLGDFATIGNLQAAAITQVNPNSVNYITADGDTGEILWEDGLKQARAFINENRRGSTPKTASDLLQVGDVVRLKSKPNGGVQLTQIPSAQASLVALNPADGAIQALVGGFDFQHSHFNRAIQAERQPGSNFKPFIYTVALENGMSPATIINDAPIVFDDASLESVWRPENDGGKFHGPTRLREALYKSRNLVSIRILRTIGVNTAVSALPKFGFEANNLPRDLSLSLGSHALTPLQVAAGYAVFANGGYRVDPHLITSIEDLDGNIIYRANPLTVCKSCKDGPADNTTEAGKQIEQTAGAREQKERDTPASLEDLENALAEQLATDLQAISPDSNSEQDIPEPVNLAPRVLSPRIAYQIDSILKDVINKGTGRRARALSRTDLAGKTGTTNGPKDAWFSGYSSHMVATAWLGFDQNYLLGRREYGGTSALPIWIDFMRVALDGKPETAAPLPEGLVSVRIDPKTGKRATESTRNAIFELFKTENVPDYAQETTIDIGTASKTGTKQTLPEDLF